MTRSPHGRSARVFAWGGGALFLGSLLHAVFAYVVSWGDVEHRSPFPASAAVGINVLLFSVFALHHSLLARSGAKRLVARLVSPELERAVYVWIASLLFIVTCALWQPLAGDWYDHRGIAIVPHVLLLGFAVWLIARAAALLDPLELAGIRPLRAPGPATAASPLMARGPYGVIRHPVYLGWILCVFGVPHMTWTRLSFALISTSYLVIAIPFEERDLTTQFGRNYDSYRRRVRWRVVPFLY